MKNFIYQTQGTCSRIIRFSIDEEGKIGDVSFEGGCPGNLTAISRLVKGRDASDVAEILKGVDCRQKGTSCSDQLSKALRDAVSCK